MLTEYSSVHYTNRSRTKQQTIYTHEIDKYVQLHILLTVRLVTDNC